MNYIISIVIGVVTGLISGLVSSLIFHYILNRSTPKIEISDTISQTSNGDSEEYRIKVVNKRKRYVLSPEVYLALVHRQNGSDGPILREKMIDVYEDDMPFIAPYDKKDADCQYAVRFRLDPNLMDKWDDPFHQYLLLRIFCIDEKSGSGKMFVQEYRLPSKIKKGTFETGLSMQIISN